MHKNWAHAHEAFISTEYTFKHFKDCIIQSHNALCFIFEDDVHFTAKKSNRTFHKNWWKLYNL